MPRSFCILLAAVLAAAAANPSRGEDYFQQDVHYTLHVHLDTAKHHLTGSELIQYTNNSPDTLTELHLHLYPNAYRNKDTFFMREYRRRFNLTLFDIPGAERSWLDISNVRVGGSSVSPRVDDTLAHLRLPTPLLPGASTTIALDFDEKVRKHIGRAGYSGDHYDFSQWYPKMVVYDQQGFHLDKFSSSGEFYGEFATFDVHITLPARDVVAATGIVTEGDPGWRYNPPHGRTRAGRGDAAQGEKTIHFHAERVHDFAWCADPTFVVQDTTVDNVHIMSFYRARNASTWQDSVLTYGVRTLHWLTKLAGPYAYPQISIVDALLGGGMEYPMLVMDGRASEGLVVHEVGHIYFYGILADNERDEAWMDEGFTSFQTNWYMTSRYGPYGDTSDWNLYQRITPQYTIWQYYRRQWFELARRGYGERVSKRSEDFQNSYRQSVYRKAATMLYALRYVVGEKTFLDIFHEYYRRWGLKHVDEARFVKTAEDVSGQDLDLFFEQWLHTKKTCDYSLDRVTTRKRKDGGYDVGVRVGREGEMVMPITLHFDLRDGTTQTRRIDSRLRTIEEVYQFPSPPRRVAINPDNQIADIDLSNNFQPRRHDFQFDWPNNFYYPEDAYQIRWRPGAWYNDFDGLKAGLLLRGSYHGWGRRLRLGLYYGAESKRLDFTARYARPMHIFGSNATLSLSGYKMEGRQDANAEIHLVRRPHLLDPPTQDFVIGYNYHELADPRYLTSTEIYDTLRADVGPYFAYGVGPQLDIASTRIDATLKLGRKWLGGKSKYERLAATAWFKTRHEFIPVDTHLRVFLGLVGGGAPPQEKFNLAGAGPLRTEDEFFLRSPGAVWKDLNYLQPGDGNLRGYREGSFVVNRLFTFNAEVGTHVPFFALRKPIGALLGTVSWAGFYDAGRIYDKGNPLGSSARIQALVDGGVLGTTLQDAGVGLRAHRAFPFWDMTLRLDVPFWVNHPEVNGEHKKTQRRYLLSLDATF